MAVDCDECKKRLEKFDALLDDLALKVESMSDRLSNRVGKVEYDLEDVRRDIYRLEDRVGK